MFERFTEDARNIVTQARDEARRRHDGIIGTQHVLLAMARSDSAVGDLLATFGITGDAVDAYLDRVLGEPIRPLAADAAALAALGIDLDRVREAIEQNFGEGALTRAVLATEERRQSSWLARHRRPLLRLRRRTRHRRAAAPRHRVSSSGHIPFSPRSKKVLELSLREALRLNQRFIAGEHVALGLLREGEGMACQVMRAQRVEFAGLRRALEEQVRKAA